LLTDFDLSGGASVDAVLSAFSYMRGRRAPTCRGGAHWDHAFTTITHRGDPMNRATSMASRRDDSWFSFFSYALIWLLLAAAGLLLAWFVAVLEDVTQRGEERRMKPRPTGALVLSQEKQWRDSLSMPLAAASSETPAGR
jgi:hypothetical protein